MTRTQTYSSFILTLLLLSIAIVFALPSSVNAAGLGTKKHVDATCMQTAVAAREDAVIGAWDAFADTMHEGLDARKTSLNTAWGMEAGVSRAKALKDAWTAWKKIRKDAHTELKADRKAAWTTFKDTVKTTCKTTLPKEESLEKDSSGSLSL